eukprot:TRINITY_DN1643_c0_g1_i3.p1 TRINITY_DN1643_c0_g1~~TRINITY_DN1643_c0_g1_i3.p1  ORF type:complete len:159 (+),score=30.74 TRINITY_DN1643_c0_g1_i3:135-611(+)
MTVELCTPVVSKHFSHDCSTPYSSNTRTLPTSSLDFSSGSLLRCWREKLSCSSWSFNSSLTLTQVDNSSQLLIPKIVKAFFNPSLLPCTLECHETIAVNCKRSFAREYNRRSAKAFLLDDYRSRVRESGREDGVRKEKARVRSKSRCNLLLHLRRVFN